MLVAFACQDEIVAERQPVVSGDEISFTVGGDSVQSVVSRSQTSAPITHRQFLATIGKDSLFLYTTIEENTDQPFQESSDSRAASVTTGNLGEFYLDAFYNGDTPFMNGTKVTLEEGIWKYSPVKYWPNNEGDYLDFYGYTDVPNTFQWNEEHKVFSYTLPSAAKDQQDLIFAQALKQKKQTVEGAVKLNFYHALSAVLFKVGSLPEDITLSNLKITLENVKDKGTCTITNNNNALSFAWDTDDAEAKNYSQTFTSSDATNGYDAADDISTISSETAFMMIPHTFEEGAKLRIKFNVGGVPHEFEHPLAIAVEGGNEWKPNTKYTYSISIEEFVEVEVDDIVSEDKKTKSEVKIQNTGLANAYIRAAIVGYWVSETGEIVASWAADDNETGTFNGLNNENWFKGNDGYYYHKAIVPVSGYTSSLFNSYSLTGNPPIVGSSLELSIVVQAVKTSDVESAWTSVQVSGNVLTEK